MRTSPVKPLVKQQGFTLLELIVVVVIVGILTTFATLSIGWGIGDEVETEAKRLQSLVELAEQEALLQGVELGMRFKRDSYEFLTLSEDKWVPVDDDLLRKRELPEYMELALYKEGSEVSLDEEVVEGAHVYILSSGEVTPFDILMQQEEGENVYLVSTKLNGKVSLDSMSQDEYYAKY